MEPEQNKDQPKEQQLKDLRDKLAAIEINIERAKTNYAHEWYRLVINAAIGVAQNNWASTDLIDPKDIVSDSVLLVNELRKNQKRFVANVIKEEDIEVSEHLLLGRDRTIAAILELEKEITIGVVENEQPI